MISCIVLSAGESRRFGSPKALADIASRKAITAVEETLVNSNIDEIVVVLGANAQEIESHVFNHRKVRIVYNKNYKFGQTSSVQCGLFNVAKESLGFLLFPVDCPWILSSTVNIMIEAFQQKTPPVLIPTFQGRRGHPPVFNASLKQEILGLLPDQGLNSLFEMYRPQLIEINDPGIVKTFNTPQELAKLLL